MACVEGGACRCLVTGASGVVGSAVVRLLVERGQRVAAMVRPHGNRSRLDDVADHVEFIEATLECLENAASAIERFRSQMVFHLAWYGSDRASRNSPAQMATNVPGSLKLLDQVLRAGAGCWVGVGSQAEYGPQPGRLEESLTPRPADAYGLAKLRVGDVSRARCQSAGVRAVWLRLLATYGPADDDRHLIPYVIRTLLAGETPRLSAGTQAWDYLYVDDAAEAIVAAAFSNASGVFNLASGSAWTVRQITTFLRDVISPGAALEFGQAAPDSLETDISRIVETIGWKPRTSLEDGLRRTVEWYRARSVPITKMEPLARPLGQEGAQAE